MTPDKVSGAAPWLWTVNTFCGAVPPRATDPKSIGLVRRWMMYVASWVSRSSGSPAPAVTTNDSRPRSTPLISNTTCHAPGYGNQPAADRVR